ncbi:MAG: nicotinamide riboside transporter PnuC [Acidobacteriota bacterium]|nr:nicotinamide riboside transporter PnuC [Acidobacteriota bacterium]
MTVMGESNRLGLWLAALVGLGLIVGAWQAWLPYSLTETLGFVTGAACVYLVIEENIFNFPVGIANNIFFIALFMQARLYGDAGLQLVYIILGIHGWYWWLRGGQNHTALKVARAPIHILCLLAVLMVIGTLGLTLVLRAVRGSAPALDALTTMLSLAAQYLLNCKFIENWYIWIIADLLYIYLYAVKGLHLTALLYFIFLCLCLAGLINWHRSLARQGAQERANEELRDEAVVNLISDKESARG